MTGNLLTFAYNSCAYVFTGFCPAMKNILTVSFKTLHFAENFRSPFSHVYFSFRSNKKNKLLITKPLICHGQIRNDFYLRYLFAAIKE